MFKFYIMYYLFNFIAGTLLGVNYFAVLCLFSKFMFEPDLKVRSVCILSIVAAQVAIGWKVMVPPKNKLHLQANKMSTNNGLQWKRRGK